MAASLRRFGVLDMLADTPRMSTHGLAPTVAIADDPLAALADYAQVSPAFTVDRVLDVQSDLERPGHFVLSEHIVRTPFVKDYDRDGADGPLSWPHRFDVSGWTVLSSRRDGQTVGWAALAFDASELIAPAISPLGNRPAVLWDLRVDKIARNQGVGSGLFQSSLSLARVHGCDDLLVETQNINVPACRLYQRHGCELRAVRAAAYPDLPDEVQLIWGIRISG